MINIGEYRYRIAIEEYDKATKTWLEYMRAWSSIRQSSAQQTVAGDTASTLNQYTVKIRFQPGKDVTTSMRVKWMHNKRERILYINGVTQDDATQRTETIMDCVEETR